MRAFSVFASLLIAALVVSRAANAVNPGTEIVGETADAFGFLLGVAFDGNPASATYLGEGYILTAAHNLYGLPDDGAKKARLRVLDLHGKTLVDVKREEYVVLLPPKVVLTRFRDNHGRAILVPEPDVLLIRVKRKYLSRFSAVPSVKYGAYLFAEPANLVIAGRGEGWKYGTVRVSELDERKRLISRWTNTEIFRKFSVPRPGDSGGPLLYFTSGGETVQIGVTDTVRSEKGNAGEIISHTAYASLAEHQLVGWLEKKTGIKPGAGFSKAGKIGRDLAGRVEPVSVKTCGRLLEKSVEGA